VYRSKCTCCIYCRFVVRGDGFPGGIVPGSVNVYRFDEQMSLTHEQVSNDQVLLSVR